MRLNEARIIQALKHPNPQEHYAAALSKRLLLDNATVIRTLDMMKAKGWLEEKMGMGIKKYFFLTGKANLETVNLILSTYALRFEKEIKKQATLS